MTLSEPLQLSSYQILQTTAIDRLSVACERHDVSALDFDSALTLDIGRVGNHWK